MLFRINQETGPAIDLFRQASLAEAEMNVRRHTSDAMLSRWPIKNVGIKCARKESLLCVPQIGGVEQKPVRHGPVLGLSFSPEAGAFFCSLECGRRPGPSANVLSKANLYAAQVSYWISSNGTKSHHVGNIGKELCPSIGMKGGAPHQ
jgi:hypothetical protein